LSAAPLGPLRRSVAVLLRWRAGCGPGPGSAATLPPVGLDRPHTRLRTPAPAGPAIGTPDALPRARLAPTRSLLDL